MYEIRAGKSLLYDLFVRLPVRNAVTCSGKGFEEEMSFPDSKRTVARAAGQDAHFVTGRSKKRGRFLCDAGNAPIAAYCIRHKYDNHIFARKDLSRLHGLERTVQGSLKVRHAYYSRSVRDLSFTYDVRSAKSADLQHFSRGKTTQFTRYSRFFR